MDYLWIYSSNVASAVHWHSFRCVNEADDIASLIHNPCPVLARQYHIGKGGGEQTIKVQGCSAKWLAPLGS